MNRPICSLGIAIALLTAASALSAQSRPDYETIRVTAPDGLSVSVQSWGNPKGPEIVFIHGFMQSHLSWAKQLRDPELAREFRMISYDFRGHGGSDKPLDAAYYNNGERFADELKAVIDATKLKRPTLVGWSYGTRIISDYLIKYGDSAIAGINFVGGVGNGDPKNVGPGSALIGKALTENLEANIAATADFIHVCFERQPTVAEFQTILAFNMVVPPKVRAGLRRPAPYEPALKAIKVPTLVTHGVEDKVLSVGMGSYLASTVPNARASFYEGVGHSPFWEDAPRFNTELASFVRAAWAKAQR